MGDPRQLEKGRDCRPGDRNNFFFRFRRWGESIAAGGRSAFQLVQAGWTKAVWGLLLASALATGCSTTGPQLIDYRPEKVCNNELIKRAYTVPSRGVIRADRASEVIEALHDCLRYANQAARNNTEYAKTHKPDSFTEDAGEIGIGAILGAILTLAAVL